MMSGFWGIRLRPGLHADRTLCFDSEHPCCAIMLYVKTAHKEAPLKNRHTDLTGQRFGKLIAIRRVPKPEHLSNRGAYWLCKCDCGGERTSQAASLKSGSSSSCGCIVGKHSITHGLTNTPEHKAWVKMRQRCENPKDRSYANYGGRGIYVCSRWQTFEYFYKDMGPRPSKKHQLDRADNNGPYSPENCRWVTQTVNLRNRRNNVIVSYNGREMTASEAAKLIGLSSSGIMHRIRKGIPLEMPVCEAMQHHG